MPINRTQLLELHKQLCDKARELMTKKNHDYSGPEGDDPFANFRRCQAMGICTPLQGALVRLTDKFSRLSTYAAAGKLMVEDEMVDDTILDLINYAVLCQGMIMDSRENTKRKSDQIVDSWQCPKCHRWNNNNQTHCQSEYDTGIECDGVKT